MAHQIDYEYIGITLFQKRRTIYLLIFVCLALIDYVRWLEPDVEYVSDPTAYILVHKGTILERDLSYEECLRREYYYEESFKEFSAKLYCYIER